MAKAELESVDYSHRITKEMAESGKGMVTKIFGGGGRVVESRKGWGGGWGVKTERESVECIDLINKESGKDMLIVV